METKHKVKITVLRKEVYPDLQKEYLADPNSGSCPVFEVGQEFILERDGERDDFWHMLDGKFCSEAWDCISRYVDSALQGGSIIGVCFQIFKTPQSAVFSTLAAFLSFANRQGAGHSRKRAGAMALRRYTAAGTRRESAWQGHQIRSALVISPI